MEFNFERNYLEVKKLINQNNFNKIFIVTGYKSYNISGANKYFKNIFVNKNTKFFFKKKLIPEIHELINIIKEINLFEPDLIIGLGGGAVLDYAKLSNVFFSEKNIKYKVEKSIFNFKKKKAKLLTIPTTAGSGAEVTPFAVLYIGNQKYSVEHSLVKPDYHFLIPELVLRGSKFLKASSGFDAISQALESMFSVKSNNESLKFSSKSLKLSINNYESFIKKPNTSNTLNMCYAANLAGRAISTAKTNGPHAVSYPFSSFYKISHGHAVSLTLNQFLSLYYFQSNKSIASFDIKKRFEQIYKILKIKNFHELNEMLKKLKIAGSLEGDYNKLNIDIKNNYNKILNSVNSQRLKNCPIKIKTDDIKSILNMKI